MVVRLCMRTGWHLDYVLTLDILTFNAFLDTMLRIEYRDRTEDGWMTLVATNGGMSGNSSGFEQLAKKWAKITGDQALKSEANDTAAFIRDLGLGANGGTV